MTGNRVRIRQPAFSLVEILVVIAVVAVLAAVIFPAWKSMARRTGRTQMVSTMRSIGVGINLYQLDHSSTLPGPLWPGQVAEYSQIEDGRLVVRLAPYLGIPEKDAPYIVPGYLTPALRKSVPSIVPEEIRVFVMNMSVAGTSGNVNPWGSLTPPISAPLARSAISKASAWAMSEAYASHPAVITRPWRTSTPPVPLYGKKPLGLFFDGSVGFFDPAEGP